MPQIGLKKEKISASCRERHMQRLAVFGSALRSNFRYESDIDLLVEFEPAHTPGLFGIARMEWDLSVRLALRPENGPSHTPGPEPVFSSRGG